MIKYRVDYGSDAPITKVEAQSETTKTVLINGRYRLKKTRHKAYFDTFAQAKESLVSHFTQRYMTAAELSRRELAKLNKAEALEER